MSEPDPRVAADLLTELTGIRKVGFWEFRARDCRTLAQICGRPTPGEKPELPIQRWLREQLDPPVDRLGQARERKPLGKRSTYDEGLFGLILFGEPARIEFPDGVTPRTVNPRALELKDRYEVLASLRHVSVATIAKGPKAREPKGGAAHRLMLDLVDALLAEAERLEPAADPPGATTRRGGAWFADEQAARYGYRWATYSRSLTEPESDGPWIDRTDIDIIAVREHIEAFVFEDRGPAPDVMHVRVDDPNDPDNALILDRHDWRRVPLNRAVRAGDRLSLHLYREIPLDTKPDRYVRREAEFEEDLYPENHPTAFFVLPLLYADVEYVEFSVMFRTDLQLRPNEFSGTPGLDVEVWTGSIQRSLATYDLERASDGLYRRRIDAPLPGTTFIMNVTNWYSSE